MKNPVWCGISSGQLIDLNCPESCTIDIRDIAHSLANINRFNGHLRHQITVARHSVYVSDLVPETLRLAALLHDAHEAYLGDIVRPVKSFLLAQHCGNVNELEDWWQECIWSAFGHLPLDASEKQTICEADDLQLAREMASLAPPGAFRDRGVQDLKNLGHGPESQIFPEYGRPRDDEKMFLARFQELFTVDHQQRVK